MAKIPAIQTFEVAKTILGKYVVAYTCPHCGSKLKSTEAEIGKAEECPECGGRYGVSKRALDAIAEERRVEADKRPTCVSCGSRGTLLQPLREFDGASYCGTHRDAKVQDERKAEELDRHRREREVKEAVQRMEQKVRSVIVTTTHILDGYRIVEYLGVDGVEYVIGTGPISEIASEFTDFFGKRSGMFEGKLRQARHEALAVFRELAVKRGANAIVGIDIDYSEFERNRTAVVVNGTLVRVERVD